MCEDLDMCYKKKKNQEYFKVFSLNNKDKVAIK